MSQERASPGQRPRLSVVIPAHNECAALADLLPALRQAFPDAEILVSDDGSTDGSDGLTGSADARRVVSPYCAGNGAAIKRGVRAASGELILLMDGDGQHRVEDAQRLVRRFTEDGYDMVVGARGRSSQASLGRSLANRIYNGLASWMTGRPIPDLTSGMRVADARKLREFLHLLPNGFSSPTTITMSFFRSGYSVGYEPIEALPRKGKSHIRPIRDGIRFLVIIFKIGSLYSPLKLFLPISLLAFLAGVGLYVHTFATEGRFTNMSVLLLSTSLLVFLIGLVSEQITSLMFSRRER